MIRDRLHQTDFYWQILRSGFVIFVLLKGYETDSISILIIEYFAYIETKKKCRSYDRGHSLGVSHY